MRFKLCIIDLVQGFKMVKQAFCRYLERLLVTSLVTLQAYMSYAMLGTLIALSLVAIVEQFVRRVHFRL
jgi:hypothetical protein